jgi:hypothetical protein
MLKRTKTATESGLQQGPSSGHENSPHTPLPREPSSLPQHPDEREEHHDGIPIPFPCQVENQYPDANRSKNASQSPIDEIRWSQSFVDALHNARINNLPISAKAKQQLRNPPRQVPQLTCDEKFSLRLFLANLNASEEVFKANRDAILADDPSRQIMSLFQVEGLIADLTGVAPTMTHMCPGSCTAYTGPFQDMDQCPYCGDPRFVESTQVNGKTKLQARQEFCTIPIGPSLQALYRSPVTAQKTAYRAEKTSSMLAEQQEHDQPMRYTDYIDGTLYQQLLADGVIGSDDLILVFSIDGAQLMKLKKSDCWIYIWILYDLAPTLRYKKHYVLPGGFIPGPKNPVNIESFLLPGLQCLSAIQREGLGIWDAACDKVFTSYPFLLFQTADGPALSHVNGLNGHKGALGCRIFCPFHSRRKQGASQYYPACKRAQGAAVLGSDHDDYHPAFLKEPNSDHYNQQIDNLIGARNESHYKQLRCETGINRISIFTGLARASPMPLCLTVDIMHLHGSNIVDLFLELWGALSLKERDASDDPRNWPWRFLVGEIWEQFGDDVETASVYLPNSFGRLVRNPCLKLTSGYTTWEKMILFWGLGPGLLYDHMPDPYYSNYCKLVFAGRAQGAYEMPLTQVQQAHTAAVEFNLEYEDLYYQGLPERLWMCPQSLHTLLHGPSEILRTGPLALVAQWVMERTIGDLKRQTRQPSKLYANFSRRGVVQSQVNSLYAIFPELAPKDEHIPGNAVDIGDGYYMLSKWDSTARPVTAAEHTAIATYLLHHHMAPPSAHIPVHVTRCARVHLPNGQIAASLWREEVLNTHFRVGRNIKVSLLFYGDLNS